MFLLIDLSQKDQIALALFNEQDIKKAEFSGRNKELLASLDSFLHKEKVDKKSLRGLAVVTGAGGFTSTRLAAVAANTLAYTLNIPLLAIGQAETDDLPALIGRILRQPTGQYVSAAYSGPPNITQPKKKPRP